MKILYFSRDYTTHDRRFLARMAESDHEVWFLRLEQDGIPYGAAPLPDGVRELRWSHDHGRVTSPKAVLARMAEFERLLSELRPDLVHAGPVQTCGFMTALAGFRPFVLMSWGSDVLVDAERDEEWRWATRFTLSKADWFVCDCTAVRQKAQQLAPLPDARILQFPWGIDLNRFATGPARGLREQLGWQEAHVVISTRTWEEIYGIDVVLEAFQAAHAQLPDLRLLLLGDGGRAGWVKQYIADHGLDAVVNCPGMVPEAQLPAYFLAADSYLTCAYSDGTSISLLEAMAAGLPVICTDAPGNREWVDQGINGWLAPAGDAQAFARELIRAATLLPPERRRIAQANLQTVESRANWAENTASLLALYDHYARCGHPNSIHDERRE